MSENSKSIREVWAIAEKRQFCKQSCTKISQGLDKLDPRSGERAIWELFQNARDLATTDASGKKIAHIKITVTPTEFIFSHKGKPFTHDSFGSLVKQVSSQEKEDEDSVGQYGTGFLTTHAFGRKILVTGSLDMEDQAPGKYVNIDRFEIDRTFEDMPEFVDKMAKQLIAIEDYADAPQVDSCREWTEFHYQLNSAEGALDKVLKGLKAAIEVLPYVLTINEPIADVTIVDEINHKTYGFKKEHQPSDRGLNVMGIQRTINGVSSCQNVYYLQSEDKLDTVIMPLKDAQTAKSLSGIAKLFVYFPLLGTEDFGMDFLFHSHRFYPVEERDALHLPVENSNVRKKFEENVAVLNSMSEMVFDYLLKNHMNITHMIDILSLSFECMKNKEDITNDFFKSFKNKWVSFYETLAVFPFGEEHRTLKSGNVKLFNTSIVESFEDKQSMLFDNVYDAIPIKTNLPNKDVVLTWSKVVRSWKDSSSNCFLSLSDLAQAVSEQPCSMFLLHSFDTYIREMMQTGLFNEYALIPNRDHVLRKANELKNGDTIPNWLSDMVKPLVADSVSTLVDTDFTDVTTLTQFSRKDLCDKITASLGVLREQYLKHNKCYELNVIKTLAAICSIFKQSGLNTYRNNAMPIICEHIGIDYNETVLPALDADERDIAQLPFKHLVENMLLEISLQTNQWVKTNYNYILQLHQSICNWSEYYDRNNKKGFAITYGAFPNKMYEPCRAEDLKYGLNLLDELMTMYQSVLGQDLKSSLINEDFHSFCEFETLSDEELASEIEQKLEENDFEGEDVLDIINHLDDERWQKWFPHISEKKAELFLKQVKPSCKNSVFRLMKIDDPDKLNQLADLADNVNIDEIIQYGKRALLERQNENADLAFKKQLGEHVENCIQDKLRTALSEQLTNEVVQQVKVVNEQYGHDLVVYQDTKPIYFIEVKSRWGTDHSVMMTPLQMRTSVLESEQYALCCVDMTGTNVDSDYHEYPDVQSTLNRIKCITNIGALNSQLVQIVDNDTENRIHIGGEYKCIVPQNVVLNYGQSFEMMVSLIVNRIIRLNQAQ